MNSKNKKIIFIGSAVVLAAAVLAVVIPVGNTMAAVRHLAERLFYAFTDSYRFKIASVSAVILLIGSLFLIFKKGAKEALLPERPYSEEWDYKWKKWKKFLWVCIGVVLLYWAPYLFQGQDVHVKIFDNLDSHIPHTKTLADSGKAFSLDPDTKLDNFLNGIPLSGVDSGYNILTWLFIIFPPFMAYALNEILIRLVALLGMVLLLKRYVIKSGEEDSMWIVMGSALCFSLLPFYSGGGISTAGIPLLLYAFFNILNRRQRFTDWLIIFIFPLYSRLALIGVFIACILFVIFIIDCIRKKSINFSYLGGLTLLTITYIFTHFHLLYSFWDPNFVSFREEIQTIALDGSTAAKRAIHSFLYDKVNVVGAHHVFVIAAAALAAIISVVNILKSRVYGRRARLLAGLTFFCLFTAILWGFKYWKGLAGLRESSQLINAFDFSRFYWFNPFLWYFIFALALLIISNVKYGKIIVSLFLVCQVLFMFTFYNWEYRYLAGINRSFAGSSLTYSLTYREFYSQDLFESIARHIGRPKKDYRVVSLGIHPGISQYNGFYTLDIYTDIYSLEYKHQFRKIIEKELEKNEFIRREFDGNAKRCFLMAADLHGKPKVPGLIFSRGITKKDQHLKIKNLELNIDALKAMGGEYIFSAVEIVNHEENNLKLEGIFRASDSPWKIYLYKVL